MLLAGMVGSIGAVMKKMKNLMGQLVRTSDVEPSTMALVERQRTNIALNVEKPFHLTLRIKIGNIGGTHPEGIAVFNHQLIFKSNRLPCQSGLNIG